MANNILTFPQRTVPSAVAYSRSSSAPELHASAAYVPQRHRGLHLVTEATQPAAPRDTQSQADRIVAQVEAELAQRARRQFAVRLSVPQAAKTSGFATRFLTALFSAVRTA